MELLREPRLTQRALAERLRLTKSGASRLLARLAAAGWVARQVDEADKRARRVSLTAVGSRLAKKVEYASLTRFTALMDGIPVEKREQVLECLDLLSRATPDPVRKEEHEERA